MTCLWMIAVIVGGVVVLRSRFLIIQVAGPSMEPTLRDGDRLVLYRGRRRLARGGIVALRTSGLAGDLPVGYPDLMVKRISAAAGDPVPSQGTVVPAGHVFVVGDNPKSLDSRAFGAVPIELVVGRVVGKLASRARQ